MRGKLFRLGVMSCALAFATLPGGGCRKASDSSNNSGTSQSQTSATPLPRTEFEQKLQYVRDGQFHHIYVFTRRDGGAFDRADVEYLTANSPVGEKTNMRVRTDDGQRVIIGTNFEYTQEQFDALGKRFNIEDYTGR
jgi:hypothetical protein